MRSAFKAGLFGTFRKAGLAVAVRNSAWRRRRLAILCYHGISMADEHEALPALFVTPALLRRRLEHLREGGYRVLALDDAVRRLARGTLPPRGVVLTFDDGTRDFAREAVPLLHEFGVPATVYPTTYYADRGQPIFDIALVYVLWRGRWAEADLLEFTGGVRPSGASTSSRHIFAALAIRAHAIDGGLGADAKDELLRRVAARVGVDYDAVVATELFQAMSVEELRALPRGLIDVQLHTHRHRVPDDPALFDREIADNRAFFTHAGVESSGVHFCYPNGDTTPMTAARLRRLGMHSAVTCRPGLARPGVDPMRLPRFVDHGAAGDATFEAWVSGAAEFIPRRRRYRAAAEGTPAAWPSGALVPLLHGLGLPP